MNMDWTRLTEWGKKYGREISLGLGFLLVGTLSFEAGLLHQSLGENHPLVIRTPATLPAPALPEKVSPPMVTTSKTTTAPDTKENSVCAYVGSKNSNKYHAPTSRCAKQIKPENRICFASLDAAKARGYLPGCLE